MREPGSARTARRALFVALLVVAFSLASTGTASVVAEAATKRVLPDGTAYPRSVERWRGVVAKYFPKTDGEVPQRLQQEALAIIWAESGGGNKAGDCDGIWQLAKCHGTQTQRLNPRWATKTAAKIYRGQHYRWRPAWTVAGSLGLD
jgi:hypothetical protein